MILQWMVMIFGCVLVLCAALLMLQPGRLPGLVARSLSGAGLYLVVLIRLLLGSALLAVATGSQHEWLLQALGWLTVCAGLFLVVIPPAALNRMAGWVSSWPGVLVRIVMLLPAAYGVFIAYAMKLAL